MGMGMGVGLGTLCDDAFSMREMVVVVEPEEEAVISFFFLFQVLPTGALVVCLFCNLIVIVFIVILNLFGNLLHLFREDRIPLTVTGTHGLGTPSGKISAVFAAVSSVLHAISVTHFFTRRCLGLCQNLAQHCKVVAAVDEFEALVVFPVVELVRGGDVEGGEEGRLVGDSGEGEGCVPGVGWREVDGKGEDAVAVVFSGIRATFMWLP